MTNTGLVTSAALLALGVAAGGFALRPDRGGGFDAARDGHALLAPHEERLAHLESDLAAAKRGQALAERQASEALSAALDARRDLERLRDRTDDLYAVLSSAGSQAAGARGAGGGAAGASALASSDGAHGATATASSGLGVDGGNVLAAGPGRAPTPDDVEPVKKAMAEVRQEENNRRRAQQAERRKQFMTDRVADLAQKIGLSPQQAEQVQAIFEGTMGKRDELFQSMREGGGDPGEMRAQMDALRAEDEKNLQTVLSAQQYQDLQKIQEEERAQRGGGPGGFFGGGPGGGFGGGGRQGGGSGSGAQGGNQGNQGGVR